IPPEIGNLGNLQWMNLRANALMGPLPLTITNLVSLGDDSSDIQMNGLYTGDPGVAAFLDSKCGPDWKDVQTITPTGFSMIGATGVSVTLGWNPIPFSWNPGGYDIFISDSPSGPFVHAGRALDKTAAAWTVFGLLPSTPYFFRICSVTDANAENRNTVVSELTAPITVATTASPSTWYAATTGVVGNDCASPATPCPTIETALAMAGPGEVVHVAPGTYTETLGIDETVMIVGAGPSTTIIEGWGWSPVIDIHPFNQLELSGVTIRNGQVQFGAGVYVGWRGRLELSDAVVTMNSAEIMGGGVYVECEGGAVLDRVTITGNTAGERGGGLGACGWTQVVDSTVTQNSAPWGGGAAFVGQGRIQGSTIADNTATEFGGGGVMNEGWLTVADSAIHGNAASLGGGVANLQWANLIVENSTISGNGGGGLFNAQYALAGLDGCTVADNTGMDTEHSGVMNWDSVAVHSTIIADNTPYNCANPVTSYGYNLESSDRCGLDGPADLVDTDPLLGPLADNGGPTWTHALDAGSPAIDAGDPVAFFSTDQRGYLRPVDGDDNGVSSPDVGAVEFVSPIFVDGFETGDTTAWTLTSP
ncbi:MAG: choice-of-anchor Q domain-containing protein, partial [Holophagae bacterium]